MSALPGNNTLDLGPNAYLLNIPFGFTTTPEQRLGPGPPYTTPALQANLFFRVFLGILAIIISFVPARLLWRNGEFAATIFSGCIVLRVLGYVINALIWRDDNVATWYAGYGWCDLQVYVDFGMDTAFNASLFEIMRGLYIKLTLNRVTSLTTSERRRQQLTSAAIIFAFPLLQVILNYLVMFRRYNVSTLIGCTTIWHFDWLFLTFYVLPTPVYIVLAAILAILNFKRFRAIEKITREAVHTRDTVMSARQHRVRRKLYFMTLGILIIVVPLILALLFLNVIDGKDYWSDPYDFDLIHYGPDPFNINFITFTTSDLVRFVDMNINYIPTLAAMVVCFVFGTSAEAVNDYRRILLVLGLGCIFPKLREEYNPDTRRSGQRSWLSSLSRLFPGKPSTWATSFASSNNKESLATTSAHVSNASRSDGSSASTSAAQPAPRTPDSNPWPDLTEHGDTVALTERSPKPYRNPWVWRTTVNLPHLRFPANPFRPRGKKPPSEKESFQIQNRPSSEKKLPAIITGTTTLPDDTLAEPPQIWTGTRSQNYPRVDTRVWSTDDALAEGGKRTPDPPPKGGNWPFGVGGGGSQRHHHRHFNSHHHGSEPHDAADPERGVVHVETEMRVLTTDENEKVEEAGDPATAETGRS
ncbi:pheromone A receptor-domain-containing protein [Echria macrotheca]|uniref:Pheromone A receptor-domain-containing protein n=1 Tax=Echria macrotheca TaxID=438768 RepID=A0AAJ0B4N9_9PEZI|nr:pheromone A receptor-domain-containing protein [Echria macrotheca]